MEIDLRIFAGFLIDHDPALEAVADIGRSHIEAFKVWQHAQPGNQGPLKASTFRRRIGMLRMFFVRIVEWGWDDAPVRVPIFFGDVPKRDEPLPRFLDDATYTRFMRALATEPRLHRRVAIELLARTGMRVGELCDLEADAVTVIGDAHWLRIPLGKLHNDRYVPLHPHLVELLAEYRQSDGPRTPGRLLSGEHGPLNRNVVARWIDTIARRAGIGHVNPHRLRHTLATQAINRGMSIEAIAALLGHRSLDMTRQYARIANRVVADEYNAVTAKVEALYHDAAARRRRRPQHAPPARRGPPPAARQRLVPTPRRARLQLRVDLRDLRPLRHRPDVPTRAPQATQPRRPQRPDRPSRTVQHPPRPRRRRPPMKNTCKGLLTAITHISPEVLGTASADTASIPGVHQGAVGRCFHDSAGRGPCRHIGMVRSVGPVLRRRIGVLTRAARPCRQVTGGEKALGRLASRLGAPGSLVGSPSDVVSGGHKCHR